MRENNYILDRFSLDVHIEIHNFDPSLPRMGVNIVFGGQFEGPDEQVVGSQHECFDFRLQVQQYNILMKFLEYSGNYTKFKTGVTRQFVENEFTREEALRYAKLYLDWKMLSVDTKDRTKQKQKDELQAEMVEIEHNYSYETLAAVR